jgi:hypothetical protein
MKDELELLTSKLLQIQTKLQYSDMQFSKMLGIKRCTWQFIRTGRRRMGSKTLLGVFRAFPKLEVFKDGKDRDLEITIKVL